MDPPARAVADTATFEPPAPQMTFPEPEPLPMSPEPVFAAAPEPEVPAEPAPLPAASLTNGHEPLFDEIDVPAILRRRMVQ
jgi:hypothetical protein